MGTNVKAQINITQVCVSKMIAARTAGNVINVSSIVSTTTISNFNFSCKMKFKFDMKLQGGLRPMPPWSIYCASKAALDALTKTMAVEFGKHKIRVVGFNPAGIQTNMYAQLAPEVLEKYADRYPLGEHMLPMEQVVNTILFLASGIAGMMTGSSVVLDGGILAT